MVQPRHQVVRSKGADPLRVAGEIGLVEQVAPLPLLPRWKKVVASCHWLRRRRGR